jgi:hypothetical protein
MARRLPFHRRENFAQIGFSRSSFDPSYGVDELIAKSTALPPELEALANHFK